jgi:hypothetical protein
VAGTTRSTVKKLAVALAAATVALYAALCAVLYFTQAYLLYHPTLETDSARAAVLRLQAGDATLKIWHVAQPGDRALVYFGGNADDAAAFIDDFTEWFPDRSLYLVNYRGYGGSGGLPSEKALLADAELLFDTIAQQHSSIDVVGRSLGSGVAVHLATTRPVHRLVLVTPYDSILSVAQRHFALIPVSWLLIDTFDSLSKAELVRSPVLVVTAEHDRLIPHAHTKRLVAKLREDLVAVIEIEGTNHDSVVRAPPYRAALEAFLRG